MNLSDIKNKGERQGERERRVQGWSLRGVCVQGHKSNVPVTEMGTAMARDVQGTLGGGAEQSPLPGTRGPPEQPQLGVKGSPGWVTNVPGMRLSHLKQSEHLSSEEKLRVGMFR